MGKTRSLQENQRYQGSIACKDGHNKGDKQYGPKRSRREKEEVAKIHRRAIPKKKKNLNSPDNHDAVINLLEPDDPGV